MSKTGDLYGRPWSEREYIIVLYSYFRHRNETHDVTSAHVRELRNLLGRTPASIVMRLQNFASIDPVLPSARKGLVNIGALGKELFSRWLKEQKAMEICAEIFIQEARVLNEPTLFNPEPAWVSQAFGKYDTLDAIGQGAFGAVCSCINSEDGKLYALKVIRPDILADKEIVARFRREIKALKAIQHPNIIRIHDYHLGDSDGRPHFVMDLADYSLTDYLSPKWAASSQRENNPVLPVREAVELLESVMSGVDALHHNDPSLVHRDINPNNILHLPKGSWVLADLGLVKLATPSYATSMNRSLGTEQYRAPEQVKDFRSADQRADVYSLGVLTWELFNTSGPPFDRSSLMLPRPLEKVVWRATERNRDTRQASVAEFRSEFSTAISAFEL